MSLLLPFLFLEYIFETRYWEINFQINYTHRSITTIHSWKLHNYFFKCKHLWYKWRSQSKSSTVTDSVVYAFLGINIVNGVLRKELFNKYHPQNHHNCLTLISFNILLQIQIHSLEKRFWILCCYCFSYLCFFVLTL